MFSKLTTRIALHKAGIPSNTFSIPSFNNNTTSAGNTNSKDPSGSPLAGSELMPFANPFANLSVPKSWHSWGTPPPPPVEVAAPLKTGERAPVGSRKLRVPSVDGRGCVVVFLRYCGCPFAEKSFLELRKLANKYPGLRCIAVSHCSKQATDKWISALGGAWAVEVVVDEEREVYASWGMGLSTAYYLLNPWTQMAARTLGNTEGIWAREVGDGGNRWQIGGVWAVDPRGVLVWGGPAMTADEQKDLIEGAKALGMR